MIQEIANNEEKFTEEINKMCRIHKMTVIDAITLFCDEYNMDIHDITPLIGSTMKEKIKLEAVERKMVNIDVNKSKLF